MQIDLANSKNDEMIRIAWKSTLKVAKWELCNERHWLTELRTSHAQIIDSMRMEIGTSMDKDII